jgi:DNA-binding NarL/FixJ family response regulator
MVDFTNYISKRIKTYNLPQKIQIVLHYTLCGYSNKEITELLGYPNSDIKHILDKIFKIFKVSSRGKLFNIFFPVEDDIDYITVYPEVTQ